LQLQFVVLAVEILFVPMSPSDVSKNIKVAGNKADNLNYVSTSMTRPSVAEKNSLRLLLQHSTSFQENRGF